MANVFGVSWQVKSEMETMLYDFIGMVFEEFYVTTSRALSGKRGNILNNNDVIQALVYMANIGENPKKYFSCANADENATKQNIQPCQIIFKNVAPAMQNKKIERNYMEFCILVQSWERNRTSTDKSLQNKSVEQAMEIMAVAAKALTRKHRSNKLVQKIQAKGK